MDSIVTTILGKINAECKAGGCVFTETLKTFVEAKFGICPKSNIYKKIFMFESYRYGVF